MLHPRTCIVLSAVSSALQGDQATTTCSHLTALAAKLRAVAVSELDLQWHEVVSRRTEDLAEYEDTGAGEEDVLIAMCSVATQQRSPQDMEGLLLSALRQQCGASLSSLEVWLTAPCLIPLALHAKDLSGLSIGTGQAAAAAGVALMREQGMAVMPEALTLAEVLEVRALAGCRIAAAEAAVAAAAPHLQLGKDLFAFREFASRGGQRFDLLFEESGAPQVFHIALESGPWLPIIRMLLGPAFKCMASVVYSRPGAEAQDWHTDGGHPESGPAGDASWGPADQAPVSAPYAICVFVALIDLDRDVGFTQFWPGTHRQRELLGFGSVAPMLGCSVDGLLKAGGCVLYDYRLMHRGMPNNSQDTERPLLQLLYHSPSYVERKNYGAKTLPLSPCDPGHTYES